MDHGHDVGGSPDRLLFTPGPLTTSRTVKEAMLRDLGSRDAEFIALVREVRDRLVALGGADPGAYTTIPIQGSGTFGLEAVVSSAVAPDGGLLVVTNGAYGRRLVQMAAVHRIPTVELGVAEHLPADPAAVDRALADHPDVSLVAVVHCETTTGIVNPVHEIGQVVAHHGRRFFVDAMSSFGTIETDLEKDRIDWLVSSANKCLEGVPGFSFVLARREALNQTGGWARTLSLDLYAQWIGLETNGQFRFTPPTHALSAFSQALSELDAEGGVCGRRRRYQSNHDVLMAGMLEMGFRPYLAAEYQSPVITSFRYPADPRFDFETFYRCLSDRGLVIYPGKVSDADCFRIGTIGRIFPDDMRRLLDAVRAVVAEMGIESAEPAANKGAGP